MLPIFKFDTTVDPIQMFRVEDGELEQSTLTRNETLSYDPVAQTVTLTTAFASYVKTKVFALTASTTDDPSWYERQSVTFTALDGHVINDPTANEDDGGVPADQDHDGSSDDSVRGDAGKNVLHGGAGDDHLSGLGGGDILHGDSGNDDLLGGLGSDVLDGGAGDDALIGGDGLDILDGGTGDDILDGGAGFDKLFGGEGNDDLFGGANNDMLDGGIGNDFLYGNEGGDKLIGGAGNDTLAGGLDNDNLLGGADDDLLNGNEGNDTLRGEIGNDELHGGIGEDKLYGGEGNDDLTGGDDNDALDGGKGNDTLRGGAGNDKELGGEGTDVFLAGQDAGNDSFGGGANIDTADYSAALAAMNIDLNIGIASAIEADSDTGIDKLNGIENVIGSAFDDLLTGSKDANGLSGGTGNDLIIGGKGSDLLAGGEGADTFIYLDVKDTLPGKADTIADFTAGDKIDLSAIDAVAKGVPGNQAFTWSDTAPAANQGAGVVWFDAASHTLYASVNANATPELAIVLTGVETLTAGDLVL